MKITAQDITRALVDLSRTLPDGDAFLREVRDGLSKHVGEENKPIRVTIVTPTGDAGSLKETVQKLLKDRSGRAVEIEEQADPSLIGGAVVTFDDEQIDMSVRG